MQTFAIGDQAVTRLSEPIESAAIARAVAAHGPAEFVSELNSSSFDVDDIDIEVVCWS